MGRVWGGGRTVALQKKSWYVCMCMCVCCYYDGEMLLAGVTNASVVVFGIGYSDYHSDGCGGCDNENGYDGNIGRSDVEAVIVMVAMVVVMVVVVVVVVVMVVVIVIMVGIVIVTVVVMVITVLLLYYHRYSTRLYLHMI